MKQLERFKLHATKRVKDKIAKFSNARKLNDGVMPRLSSRAAAGTRASSAMSTQGRYAAHLHRAAAIHGKRYPRDEPPHLDLPGDNDQG
jgi:hypothetical protein